MSINVVDLGIGNIQSIKNWIERANIKVKLVSKPEKIDSEIIVLPGVGSAGPFMKKLRHSNFDKLIKNHFKQGKRIIGICLGFQVLTKFSEEDGGTKCMGLLNARVERLHESLTHNAWEKFYLRNTKMNSQKFNSKYSNHRKKIINGRVFYNHEYGVINEDKKSFSIPISENFSEFSGLIVKDKIIGIQFHPEKSQNTGLEIAKMIL